VAGPGIERFEAAGPAGKLAGIAARPSRPAGLPIVFLHGINMSRDVWMDVLERLAPARRVVAVDLRGHGESGRRGPFRAEDYAEDTLAVMDHLAIARAHLVGTSFGGAVACAASVKAPARVASIAAFGAALAIEGVDLDGAIAVLRRVGVRDFFAPFLRQMTFPPGVDETLVERSLDAAANGRDVETIMEVSTTALKSDLTATATAVQLPALVVTGELDRTAPVAAGAAMARALGAEHRVVAGRGHVLSMEDPDLVARLITAHVESAERG
jgi:pimeloyl-ACP methyl ester carboxylesterase